MSVVVSKRMEGGAPPRRPGWKVIGWQGISVAAPGDWNLVGYGGDAKTGSLRVDNGEVAATGALGLDVRWSKVKGALTAADLEKRLEPFFAGIVKTARRQKLAADTKHKSHPDARHPERSASLTFSWHADRKAQGRIWHCRECGRLIIAQVVGGAKGHFTDTAADVLASLECHSSEIGWQTWSLYDLLTQVPTDYALKGQPQLMNIYVQLAFLLGQSTDTVTVEQWGVANVQLRGAYLDEWYRQKNSAQEPSLRYEATEATVHGHPALALTGRRGGLHYWVTQAAPQAARLEKPATHFTARIWECPESNKIHLVQSFSRRPQPDLLEEIVERTPCHC